MEQMEKGEQAGLIGMSVASSLLRRKLCRAHQIGTAHARVSQAQHVVVGSLLHARGRHSKIPRRRWKNCAEFAAEPGLADRGRDKV
eukprot:3090660-Pleurochrysis_carterae.AAC.1